MTASERYCIVGAGPAGLTAARALLQHGIEFEVLEKHSDSGGIWDPENAGSPMYESAHFISSKTTSGFYGLPMPDDYPDYPTYRQIRDYIRAFAVEFGLYDHIVFNAHVERTQLEDDGSWTVAVAGEAEPRRYRGLICANGTTWTPNLPTYPGLEMFGGEVRHANTYRDPTEFRGRRVLVVGAGNSGVDIACDAARNAESSFFSVRRGYHYIPKHLFGIPTDVFLSEEGAGELPGWINLPEDPGELVDAMVGDLTRYGLPAPDHAALATHPIMNTEILHHLSHGDILAKPDVAELRADTVVFTDGSEEPIDLVLFATGYQWAIPYVDESLFEWRVGHPQLYLNIFNRTIDNLYVLGMIEFASAAYQRFDDMAQLVAGDIRATLDDAPEKALLRELKAEDHPDLRGEMEYIDSPRHTNYVEVHQYMHVLDELRDRLGWSAPSESSYEDLRRRSTARA
jgi:hypothetical protein